MTPAQKVYGEAIALTSEHFGIPVALIESILTAHYDKETLDKGAEMVVSFYVETVRVAAGKVAADFMYSGQAGIGDKHAGNSRSGSKPKSPAKVGPNKSGNSRGEKRNRG